VTSHREVASWKLLHRQCGFRRQAGVHCSKAFWSHIRLLLLLWL